MPAPALITNIIIPKDGSLSNAVDITSGTVIRIYVPPEWSSAPLSFLISPDNVLTYANFECSAQFHDPWLGYSWWLGQVPVRQQPKSNPAKSSLPIQVSVAALARPVGPYLARRVIQALRAPACIASGAVTQGLVRLERRLLACSIHVAHRQFSGV